MVQLTENGGHVPDSLKHAYSDARVKTELMLECHDKCAYCESKVPHVYPGDVEHMLPKEYRPDLLLNYANLTIACYWCNNAKRAYYDPDNPLIDPYLDDPNNHLFAAGHFVMPRFGDDKGEITETVVKLNRPELVRIRQEHLAHIRRIAELHAKCKKPLVKAVLERSLSVRLQSTRSTRW